MGITRKHEQTQEIILNNSTIPNLHTPSHFVKTRPKSGPSYRRQVIRPQPQTLQGESVAKPETLL